MFLSAALAHHLLAYSLLLLGIGFFGEGLDDLALLDARGAGDEDAVASLEAAGDGIALPIIDGADGDLGEGQLAVLVDGVDELLVEHLDRRALGNEDSACRLGGYEDRTYRAAMELALSVGEVDTQRDSARGLVDDATDALDRALFGVFAAVGEAQTHLGKALGGRAIPCEGLHLTLGDGEVDVGLARIRYLRQGRSTLGADEIPHAVVDGADDTRDGAGDGAVGEVLACRDEGSLGDGDIGLSALQCVGDLFVVALADDVLG